MRWTGEDVFTNISLRTKLLEQDVSIPEFEMVEDKEGIDEYFKKVSVAISGHETWDVVDAVSYTHLTLPTN